MIALVDYGIGNLRSVYTAFKAVGAELIQTSDKQEILAADKVVLPGVGAFARGMQGLEKRGLVEVLQEVHTRGTPLLGICVGMQLFFESSTEQGFHKGLAFLPGEVKMFEGADIKVPQTGWNLISPVQESPLMANLPEESYVYFNHAYYCTPAKKDHWVASTNYGHEYASMVGNENLYGLQFHAEKSQEIGLQIFKNFVELI